MKIVLRVLGIVFIVLSLLLLIAVPPAGVIGIIIGVLCLIRSNKKLSDKITAYLAKSREKTEQKYSNLKENFEEQKQKLKNMASIQDRITSSTEDEFIPIPVEEYLKDAIVSSNGLYPHEILVLNYAPKFFTKNNDFQKFWWYRYGIKDVDGILSSLHERGFLQIGDLKSSLENENSTALKNCLKKHSLKISGNKSDLVQRLLDEVPLDKLGIEFPKRLYQLTVLGKEEIKKEEYVLFIHNHPKIGLGIWSLNKMVYSDSQGSYLDKIWSYLGQNEPLKTDDEDIAEKLEEVAIRNNLRELSNSDRSRMETAGLKLYVWSTCGDERVCDACKIMDEKLCRWESSYVFSEDGGKTWKRRPNGAIMMHPGQHEGCKCRCTPMAYYPELVGEM
jgi:hypothetical protein